MKEAFCSLIMAFSMFSVIPMPRIRWKEENMRYIMAWLPLVGAAAGALQLGWFFLCELLSFGPLLFAVGLTALPVFLSGGIHMDGFSDTVDALASHASPQRKREILKDPHTGAFAVLFCCIYLLLFTALCTELPRTEEAVLILGIHQILSRVIGAVGSVCFPSFGEGLQHTFRDAASQKTIFFLAVWAAGCGAAYFWLSPLNGVVCAAVSVFCLLYLYMMSKRKFGGMSGDLAGYMIALGQLLMLLSYVVTERVVAL